jgi:hypothetical protein
MLKALRDEMLHQSRVAVPATRASHEEPSQARKLQELSREIRHRTETAGEHLGIPL